MALDPSIFVRFAPAPKSVADYDQEAAQLQGTQQANALNALRIQQGQRTDQEAQRLLNERVGVANALAGLPSGADMPTRINALYGLGTQSAREAADTMNNTWIKQQQTTADTAEKTAKTNTETYGLQQKKLQSAVTQMAAFTSPQDAIDHMNAAVGRGELPMQQALALQRSMPQDPAKFPGWQLSTIASMMDPEKYINAAKPNVQVRNTGGTTDVLSIPGLGGPASVVSSVKNTVSPDALQQASTSRQNNAANIAKDYAIAGLNADGTPSGTVESMAQMIAAGKSAPITGFALARPQGQMVMQRVMQINPQFDATDYAAKSKAARDFGTGSQGNAMRSFAVAGQHLDQLGTLVDALGNRDTQIVNKIANAYAEQTGNPAPTNFDAAKDIVSKEVVKAIVAGGGGVSEREELARLMSSAKSPAQLKGVIAQYRGLMGAQHDALLQQRRAAGLPDSTLPSYSGSDGGSGVPADIAAILQKHGAK